MSCAFRPIAILATLLVILPNCGPKAPLCQEHAALYAEQHGVRSRSITCSGAANCVVSYIAPGGAPMAMTLTCDGDGCKCVGPCE